jgi:eukaryotic-like serine/threonine-protein kinase
VGNLLYIGSCSGNFYALDKNTGDVRWSYNIHQDGSQTSFHCDPVLTSDSIIIGTDVGKQGHVYAFDRATGKVRWKYLVTTGSRGDFGINSDLAQSNDAVYAVTTGDELVCLDSATGSLRWHFTSGPSIAQSAVWYSSPSLYGKMVLFGGWDGSLYALDAYSGKPIWRTNLHAPVSTTPLIIGDSILVATEGRFYRLRPKDGAQLGSFTFSGDPWRNITVTRGNLFAMSDLGQNSGEDLVSLNLTSHRVNWKVSDKDGWGTAWPYLWHDEVLASDNGHLYAYRETDGSLAWSHDFPKQLVRGIGVTPNLLYVGTMHGMIYAFSPPQR